MVTVQQRLRRWAEDARQDGASDDLRRYLYTRALRVDPVSVQKTIFAAVAVNEAFGPGDRLNALVALAWKIVEDAEVDQAGAMIRRLQIAAPKALALPPSLVVREDRLHVSISVLTVLWHLHLLMGDQPKLSKVLMQIRDVATNAPALSPVFYFTSYNVVRGYMMLSGRLLSKNAPGAARRYVDAALDLLRRGMALSEGNNGKVYFAEFATSAQAILRMMELQEHPRQENLSDLIAQTLGAHALRVNRPELLENLRNYIAATPPQLPRPTPPRSAD